MSGQPTGDLCDGVVYARIGVAQRPLEFKEGAEDISNAERAVNCGVEEHSALGRMRSRRPVDDANPSQSAQT